MKSLDESSDPSKEYLKLAILCSCPIVGYTALSWWALTLAFVLFIPLVFIQRQLQIYPRRLNLFVVAPIYMAFFFMAYFVAFPRANTAALPPRTVLEASILSLTIAVLTAAYLGALRIVLRLVCAIFE